MFVIWDSGETVEMEVTWNDYKCCPNLIVREGQTFGEAARLSGCICEACRSLGSEEPVVDLDI